MMQLLLLPILFVLLLILLAAAVILRSLASVVEQFATREGTPHLATGVLIVGVVFLGQGLALIVVAGMYQAFQAIEFGETLSCVAAILLAAYLLTVGVFCLWWSRRLGEADSSAAVERGLHLAWLLYWGAALVAIGLWVLACLDQGPATAGMIAFGLPLMLVSLFMIGVVEGVLGWGKRMERRHWDLWQMYLAVRGRRPLVEELEFLCDHSWGPQRRRLETLCEELREGVDVENVFVRPAFLTATEGAYLASGWKSGRMQNALRDMLQRRILFTRELLQSHNPIIAVAYVWLLLLIVAAISSFLMYWIVPKFKKIFEGFGTDLPALTKMVINSSDTVVNYWYLAMPGLLALWAVLTVTVLLPFIGGFSRLREWASRFWPRILLPDVLRGLALTTESRLPLEEALAPFIRWQLQAPLHSRLVRVQEAIREGRDCWEELAGEKLLTPREAALLQSAQRAGNLPWALNAVGRRFEESWQFRFLFWLEFVRPVMLISLGVFVAVFDLAFFLPLVKLINDLS